MHNNLVQVAPCGRWDAQKRSFLAPLNEGLCVIPINKAMQKKFKLAAEDIKDIALGHGRCRATDMITVKGKRIGYMYREDPRDDMDSGWSFMWGRESQKYMNDPSNIEIFDVNTIANYSPDIIEFLDAPYGSAFERNSAGMLEEIHD